MLLFVLAFYLFIFFPKNKRTVVKVLKVMEVHNAFISEKGMFLDNCRFFTG